MATVPLYPAASQASNGAAYSTQLSVCFTNVDPVAVVSGTAVELAARSATRMLHGAGCDDGSAIRLATRREELASRQPGELQQDWYDVSGTSMPRVVTASREIAADTGRIFELIADPARQPLWDGNDNLAVAPPGQRVRSVGDVFTMKLTGGSLRHNHVVEFVEGRLIAWRPSEPGGVPPGHLWRWELTPASDQLTHVTHTYDWTNLTDPARLERAQSTGTARLDASLARLAEIAERAIR